ncbi:MAG TPA: hypothetical protein VJ203_05830 [Bacteroidales bacterium]|nr:hypothetical protein [Bacteroidales bacterium]
MKIIIAFFLLFSLCLPVWSQGEIDTQEKVLYQNERSVSVSLNSNGFAGGYRFGKRKTYLNKTIYDVELAYIKHPKEVKVSASPYSYATSRKYVYGKTNLFVNLRPSIGIQREVFSKEDRGSIAVKYYLGAGPSIGISKPIYYSFNIIAPIGGVNYIIDTRVEKFDFSQHAQSVDIAGRASFWKGFDEIALYPGLHGKLGISFEYGTSNRLINALDAGMVFDAFTRKVPIMFSEYNNQFYLTLFLGYRFGWIVDQKYKAPKITREGQVISD